MRVLIYFPHNPWPPRTGAHRRCLQIIRGLLAEGADVWLASSTRHSDGAWTNDSIAGLRREGVREVCIFRAGRLHRLFERAELKWRRARGISTWYWQGVYCSSWMRLWFSWLVSRIAPDAIVINYVFSEHILNQRWHRPRRCVLEMHDCISINAHMQQALQRLAADYEDRGHSVDYFDETMQWAAHISIDPSEIATYDTFDRVIAISNAERTMISTRLHHADAVYFPFLASPSAELPTHTGPAVFVASNNPFNRQGMLFFVHRVLASVLERAPDFQLEVIGDLKAPSSVPRGLRFAGYVEDLVPVLRRAAFFVSPVYGGTGQQLKITEAMSAGLPVVAFERPARESGLEHEVSGLIASSATEFAGHVTRLWQDRTLCARLGAGARNAVLARMSAQPRITDLLMGTEPTRSQDRLTPGPSPD